jgi:sulfur relay (sulfurtransferase) complex TusBCD TusD component (DsrE family)
MDAAALLDNVQHHGGLVQICGYCAKSSRGVKEG